MRVMNASLSSARQLETTSSRPCSRSRSVFGTLLCIGKKAGDAPATNKQENKQTNKQTSNKQSTLGSTPRLPAPPQTQEVVEGGEAADVAGNSSGGSSGNTASVEYHDAVIQQYKDVIRAQDTEIRSLTAQLDALSASSASAAAATEAERAGGAADGDVQQLQEQVQQLQDTLVGCGCLRRERGGGRVLSCIATHAHSTNTHMHTHTHTRTHAHARTQTHRRSAMPPLRRSDKSCRSKARLVLSVHSQVRQRLRCNNTTSSWHRKWLPSRSS